MTARRLSICLSIAAILGLATVAHSEDAPGEVEITLDSGEAIRLQHFGEDGADIELDGLLREEAWRRIDAFDRMRVTEPDTLVETPYSSKVLLFYTDRGLYVGFDLEQPADTFVRRFTVRDDGETNRDFVSITLDTSGSGRFGYWMALALGDNQRDGTILPERQYSREWDGAWYGATEFTDAGWSAEFLIPWSQMAMPKSSGTRNIGLFVSRKVAHLNQRWSWPALPGSQARFISAFQPMHLDGVDPRQQWSLFPSVANTYDSVVDNMRYRAGFDAFWRPSTNFQLTATVNPDFGAVESDDVDINLTANETFFPEKRLFFQEGREIFNTTPRAGGNDNFNRFTMINTRRIGSRPRELDLPTGFELSDRQELRPADVIAAGKATGQLGALRYGIIAAVEDDTSYDVDGATLIQDGRNFGAIRAIYEDNFNAAYRGLGFISTLVTHPESDALVNGVDAHFLSTDGHWKIDGQLFHSDVDEEGSGIGVLGDIIYQPRQGLRHFLQLTYFDDTVDVNDFGFLQQNDMREIRYRIDITKSDITWARDIELFPFIRYRENSDGFRIGATAGIFFDMNLNNLDRMEGSLRWSPEIFDDRNSFDNGTFRGEEKPTVTLEYQTNTARKLSIFGRGEYRGEDTGGYQTELKVGANWQPFHNLRVEGSVEFGKRDGWLLHEEDQFFTEFNADIFQPELRVDFFPSAKQQLRVALQWVGIQAEEDRYYALPPGTTDLVDIPNPWPVGDRKSFSISQLNFQIRYRWQIAPLSDLFIVYTKGDRRDTELIEFNDMFRESWQDPLIDQIVLKIRYRLGS
ncbi:MAG: hypothetical protein KJO31_18995 [Gammaproteobacteria bacterium]|nr:hypothetical protein [Gammaproteobacteria bacterium]